MAIQRQNPQFDPQRIVQPTATPIDTYFRPMLRQPEQPKILQVAAALSDISPQLGRLASDAMAANIAAQKEYGEYEASTEKDPEVLRRKATEAIEGAGGIAPWRYQAFLEAYGQRLVRDKYRNALYENLDDLSNPYNADGTVRPPTYVAEQMNKLYEQAGIPTESYFMNKGAAAARAEADNSFYERLMGARRQKVMDASRDTLADGIQFAIDTNPDMSALFGKNGAIKVLSDRYYQNGGQDGDDIVATGVLNAAKGLAAEGDYDRALDLLRFPIEEKIGDRTMGARHRARLQEAYDIIERKSRDAELSDYQNMEARKGIAMTSVQDKVMAELQAKKQNTRFLSMDMTDIMELVDKNMSGVNMEEGIKLGVRGRMVDWTRNYIDALNRPEQKDPRSENIAYAEAFKNSQTMDVPTFREYAMGALSNELITAPQFNTLMQQNQAFNSMSDTDRQQMNLRLGTISGTSWTGLAASQIARDAQAELEGIGNRATSDIMAKFFAEVNSPEFKQKYPDEIQQAMARDQVMSRLVGEAQSSLLSQHRGKIDQANLAASFDATMGEDIKAEASAFSAAVLADIPEIPEGYFATGLGRRISSIMYERIRSEWGRLMSEPGQPAMTLEQRKRAMYERLPDIADKLQIELTTAPEKLGLPVNYVTILRGAAAPAELGDSTSAAVVRPVSRGIEEFKTGAWFDRRLEYNPLFPSEPKMVEAAREVLRFAAEAQASPEKRVLHNESKARFSKSAENFLDELRTITPRKAIKTNRDSLPPALFGMNGPAADTPLYQFKEDGVYSTVRLNGESKINDIATRRYWAAKALVGYTADELSKGMTSDGVKISKENLDATEYLYFRSVEDFSKAMDEYANSGGKTGIIAETFLPLSGMSFADFRSEQLGLLRDRKPLP